MNRSFLLTVLLLVALGACSGLDPVGPQSDTTNTDVPFSAERHVLGALASHYGVTVSKPAAVLGSSTFQTTFVPQADYVEMSRDVLPSGDIVVRGQYLFFYSDWGPRHGTLESIFSPADGLWQHTTSVVSEGPVDAIPLTVRIRQAESDTPLNDVEVVARRQGSAILSSQSLRTDLNGEAQLEVFRGVFDLEALSEQLGSVATAELIVSEPGTHDIPIDAKFNRIGKRPPIQP